MSKSTIRPFSFSRWFPDQEVARVYLEGRLWPNGVSARFAALADRIGVRKDGYLSLPPVQGRLYSAHRHDFRAQPHSLHKWIYGHVPAGHGPQGHIVRCSLPRKLASPRKSAWFMLHRLREACGDDFDALKGIIEIDEMYVGGKESNKA